MDEIIGNVKLNLDYYAGTDIYSDGDIEDRILEIVKENDDPESVLLEENEWPLLYHLSEIRKNVLRWYDFNPKKSLLEIGAGCGAITGLFCERCRKVTGVDLSKRRSTINAYRNKTYDNLELIVGNFEDIVFSEKYDYVTLIGVLEYSVCYLKSETPFLDMLKKAKSLLKDDGVLLLAIENKYGLKYWSGAKEDHTGRYFDGIQGYKGVKNVRTFSKKELTELLMEAGFERNDFYIPVPDYKMPLEVYAEEQIPNTGILRENTPAYDNERMQLFNEIMVADELCKDDMYVQFANSFVVVSR